MDHNQKLTLLIEYLSAEGYCPTLDDDGDVLVKVAGNGVLIRCQDDDPTYYRVARPFMLFEDVSLGYRAVACDVSASIRVAKLGRFHQYFAALAEAHYETLGDFQAQLPALLCHTEALIHEYLKVISKIEAAREVAGEEPEGAVVSVDPSSVSVN